ncbi:MAG: hypothetical protein ACPGXK_03135 [Phycisphaerae bacterium]
MDSSRKLFWIQKNRQRNERAKPASLWADALAQSIMEDPLDNELCSRIREVVDEQFIEQCRVSVVSRGTLKIYMADTTLLSWMKRRWQEELLQSLRAFGIKRLAFEYGQSGQCL